ncbi:MAG TPA: TIGR03086 family metal-binding protein [Actinomycetes bacterium]|nr:TIGR03086 family metal-binding protein [Actinomycetes bacterium]
MTSQQTDTRELFRQAVDGFGRRVHAVAPDQWHDPTPCTEWDVRALVSHLVDEALWATPLLDGATLQDASTLVPADPLAGDQDPVSAWERAADALREELAERMDLDAIVHLSYGDVPAREYVEELTFDFAVHSWDLARAVGADESIDPPILEAAWSYLGRHGEGLAASGRFGPVVDVPDDADTQTRVLAATGRAAR